MSRKRVKTGTPTGTVYVSPSRKAAYARRLRREEQRWAAKSGPVTVIYREILPKNDEILPDLPATANDLSAETCG